jgi:uncharacterized metal-binding protein
MNGPADKENNQGGFFMSDACCAANEKIMLLSCSGGSNVGQLSNRAAVELTREGFGTMYCLAGIGGRLSGFVQSASDVKTLVTIDGCSLGCARAALEGAGVPVREYLVITDLGIEKNKEFSLKQQDIHTVKEAVKETCKNLFIEPVTG